jgi:hypothetical protein
MSIPRSGMRPSRSHRRIHQARVLAAAPGDGSASGTAVVPTANTAAGSPSPPRRLACRQRCGAPRTPVPGTPRRSQTRRHARRPTWRTRVVIFSTFGPRGWSRRCRSTLDGHRHRLMSRPYGEGRTEQQRRKRGTCESVIHFALWARVDQAPREHHHDDVAECATSRPGEQRGSP